MIRKNLLRTALITTVAATLLTATACGKKSVSNTDNTTQEITTVSTETKTVKELTRTGLVTFDYTDEDGNTYTLEGKAVAGENGDATIEVADANGNKVTFTGKATTTDGKLSVSDIAVKDAGTLVKADGTEIKVSTGSTVADASESTEGESNSDIAASDDVKKEVEDNKKEEEQIAEERKEDTIVADNNTSNADDKVSDAGSSSDNRNEDNNTSGNDTSSDNKSNVVEEPKEEVKDETPAKEPEVSTEAPTEKQTEELRPGQPGYDYSSHTPVGAGLYGAMEGDIPYDILVEYSKGELSAEQAEAKLLTKLGRNNSVEGFVQYSADHWGNPEQVYILKCHFWVEDLAGSGALKKPYYTDYSFEHPAFQWGEGVMDYDKSLMYHCAYVVLPITM